jgi:16S rRNA (guanine527-N7)-methyltransferase
MNPILSYFPEINAIQNNHFLLLKELYLFWNQKVNVISRKDMDNFLVHHVLHSLAIAKTVSFAKGNKILDVGTGGGFPGIPLAILFPETEFLLIDSIGKKIAVVNEITKELGLKNVRTKQIRAEELTESFDFAVSRAVTQMPKFVGWIKGKIKPKQGNGIYYLKGGDLGEELKEFGSAQIFSISGFFSEDFFLTKKVVHIPFRELLTPD